MVLIVKSMSKKCNFLNIPCAILSPGSQEFRSYSVDCVQGSGRLHAFNLDPASFNILIALLPELISIENLDLLKLIKFVTS